MLISNTKWIPTTQHCYNNSIRGIIITLRAHESNAWSNSKWRYCYVIPVTYISIHFVYITGIQTYNTRMYKTLRTRWYELAIMMCIASDCRFPLCYDQHGFFWPCYSMTLSMRFYIKITNSHALFSGPGKSERYTGLLLALTTGVLYPSLVQGHGKGWELLGFKQGKSQSTPQSSLLWRLVLLFIIS